MASRVHRGAMLQKEESPILRLAKTASFSASLKEPKFTADYPYNSIQDPKHQFCRVPMAI